MRKTPVSGNNEQGMFNLERRDFMVGGLALAATAMLPRFAFSAPAKKLQTIPRRKLGALEISAIGLGCMSMNSGNYNPPKDKGEMIRLLHAAVDRGITYFDTAEVYGPFVNEALVG
jgi:hypothetical protein